MKRFILLFVMAVFTIMATSFVVGTVRLSAAQPPDIPANYILVVITPANENPHGNNPDLNPWYVNLRYNPDKFNDQVKWVIISTDVKVFKITFDKEEGSPFVGEDTTFTNEGTNLPFVVSGRIRDDALPEGAMEKVFRYTLEVGGQIIDPGVVVHR